MKASTVAAPVDVDSRVVYAGLRDSNLHERQAFLRLVLEDIRKHALERTPSGTATPGEIHRMLDRLRAQTVGETTVIGILSRAQNRGIDELRGIVDGIEALSRRRAALRGELSSVEAILVALEEQGRR